MDVEIWSDINCPWCYIGKRRLESALSQFAHADQINVTWRSFELDPEAPVESPGNGAARIAEKYGVSVERAHEMEQNVTDIAAGEGLEYDLEHARIGSSFDGHRLIHLAARHGLQNEMEERLFRARFTDGKLISDHDTLVELAVELGLDADEVRTMLAGDEFADEVRQDEATAHRFGISGVPMFVVDRAFGASGAQPPEQLLVLLRHGWEAANGSDQPRADSA
ncbi:MAG TPA: DsbA family oxidoreductase [Solirubrobacteraceae bacterium]|nr:DsbA family oxidoreductase [Solirubrobacteraceae bacterium]